MFGSNVLEVAIGVVFVYLLLSLLCSTINEQVIIRILALRARTLEDGIKNMMADPQGDKLVAQLYANPLIKGLTQSATKGKSQKPSYIPANIFATALLDIIQPTSDPSAAANPAIPDALVSLLAKANNDVAKEMAAIEKWFNDTMDRVSGWYKRRVQLIIMLLAFIIVVGLNIDSISLITSLSNDAVIRSTIVSAAQGAATTQPSASLPTLVNNIKLVQPVIGWTTSALPVDFWGWLLKIVGLLATTFAVSLGAPFWFDVLNKFVALRSSGPPPQSSTSSTSPVDIPAKLVVENNPPSTSEGSTVAIQ